MSSLGEFDLIKRFFKRPAQHAVLGVGDDCALLQCAPGMQLAISTDMLVQDRHFFADVDPRALGHKALAVNLSDLAACGARPLAFTLALALPRADEAWLAAFAGGLLALADLHGCELIGGDTTHGPLNICITVFGEVPAGQALLRSGAQVGDDIYVSGTLGDARLALDALRGQLELPPEVLDAVRLRLEQPQPRVALGCALRGLATAAIDISDGLSGDLGHILEASGVGALIHSESAIELVAEDAHYTRAKVLNVSKIATARQFEALTPAHALATRQRMGVRALDYVMAGGDDYELAFTASPTRRGAVAAAATSSQTRVTRIGRIEAGSGLRVVNEAGEPVTNPLASFDHFA